MANNGNRYVASTLEKVTAGAVSVMIVALVGYLVVRNQPFADAQLAAMTRILLSLAIAVLGATIPGFLEVDWSVRGFSIRAAGALALFVVSYFWSPKLVPQLSPYYIQPLKNPRPVSVLGYQEIPRLILVAQGSGGLKLRAAFQGDSVKGKKLYDLTVSNDSSQQELLGKFHVRCAYIKGVLSAIEEGTVLHPQEKYSVSLPIDTDKDGLLLEKDVAMSPAIVLPPRNESGPSVATIRLEVLYQFVGRLHYHPNSDWDILYDISVEDERGQRLTLMSRSWRQDRNVDWVGKYANKR